MQGEPVLVMLVEDNLDHAELIMRTLADHRVANEVIHFNNGQSALDYLWQQGEFGQQKTPRPHVILLDLRLPRIDGLEVLRTLKASTEHRHIPVVVLTTSEAEKDMVRAYDNYVNSYLVKPVGYNEFTNLLESLGFYWLSWNSIPK